MALLGTEPVGMVSAVRYGQRFGFIGLYIVRPAHRGQGHGLALWRAGMAHLAGRTIGLDGVVAQQGNYRQSGFAFAHHTVRYQGVAGAAPAPLGADSPVQDLAGVSFEAVYRCDRACFPEGRAVFLRHWLALPGSTALGVLGPGGVVRGYGVIRPCRSGHKVGPLLADTPELATLLLDALAGSVPAGTPIQFDVPATHLAAVALAESRQMVPVFQTARMYAGPAPDLPLHRLYGVTTLELG